MKKKLSLFLLLLLLPIWRVKGLCSNAELVRLNQLARNVTTSYEYYLEDDTVKFKVTLTNLNSNLTLTDLAQNKVYKNKNGELIIDDYDPGTIIKYAITAKEVTCTNQNLVTLYVNLPSYNPYYNDQLCKTVSDYKYCQKWISMPFKYADFKKNIQAEINSRNQKNSKDEAVITESKSFIEIIFDFYLNYYYVMLPIIIIACAIGMYYLNKKNQLFVE